MNIVTFNAETGETIERPLTDEEISEIKSISDSLSTEVKKPVVVVNAVDLWERMTDEEAESVGIAMAEQPFRVRKIFETAKTFREDHELWPLLKSVAESLFGEERAEELLSASYETLTVDTD